jgi:hypothetical protein
MPWTTEQQYFIDNYRSFLSMRETKAAGSSYQLPSKFGDEELWEDLRLGLNMFNSTPPILTYYSFKDMYTASAQASSSGQDPMAPTAESSLSIFMTSVMMCAMFFSGMRAQWFEAGKHFRYNDNGISIERVKQQDYQNVGTSILQYIQTVLPQIRKTMAFERISVSGQFSGMIAFPRSLTRGLRGTRLGFGG